MNYINKEAHNSDLSLEERVKVHKERRRIAKLQQFEAKTVRKKEYTEFEEDEWLK